MLICYDESLEDLDVEGKYRWVHGLLVMGTSELQVQ